MSLVCKICHGTGHWYPSSGKQECPSCSIKPLTKSVTGEIVAMALNATSWHRSEIQCFIYHQDDGTDLHVVRDCTKPYDEQVLWKEFATKSEYENAFKRKMLAKERAEADVIAERINMLMGNKS